MCVEWIWSAYIVWQRFDATWKSFSIGYQTFGHIITLFFHPTIVDNDILVAKLFVTIFYQTIGGPLEQLLTVWSIEFMITKIQVK